MSKKILVAYASRAGSTSGVAEAIARTLAESGVPVDVRQMKDIQDLTPYRAVVVGSAVQKSKWLPEAMKFLETHHAALTQMPCAMFTVCITLAMSNEAKYRSTVTGWVAPVRAKVAPVSEGLFAGLLDFSKLPFSLETLLLRAAVIVGIFPSGDHRDWNAIRAWATDLKPLLIKNGH